MTSERLLIILKNPDELERISYQELKTLSLAYPYSANFRMLLLLKSDQEKHWEKQQNLALAALYTPDRARLFELMAPRVVISRHLEAETVETYLELKPLATVTREIAAKKSVELEVEAAAPPVLQKSMVENPKSVEKKPPVFSEKNHDAELDFSVDSVAIRLQKSAAAMPPNVVSFQNLMRPAPTVAVAQTFVFAEWYGQFNLPILPQKKHFKITQTTDNQLVKPVKTSVEVPVKVVEKPTQITMPTESDLEKNRDAAVKKLVKKSVKEKDEILSETLAKVYEKQGYKDKSVAMYQKLMVAFPEKSATFAAEIEKMGR